MTKEHQPEDRQSGKPSQETPAKQSLNEHSQSAKPRGFAAMDEQRQRDIASAGGRAAHEKGTAHEFDSEEARAAGKKGGEAVSEDRQHMAEIGRKGGEARQAAAAGNRGSERSAERQPDKSRSGNAASEQEKSGHSGKNR